MRASTISVADFPDNPLNLLAMANALAGFAFVHLDYTDVDIDDPNNTVYTVGNTTYVLVPTENLPLLEPLRLVGLDSVADALNEPLKAMVESGYDRSIPAEATSVSSPAAQSVSQPMAQADSPVQPGSSPSPPVNSSGSHLENKSAPLRQGGSTPPSDTRTQPAGSSTTNGAALTDPTTDPNPPQVQRKIRGPIGSNQPIRKLIRPSGDGPVRRTLDRLRSRLEQKSGDPSDSASTASGEGSESGQHPSGAA